MKISLDYNKLYTFRYSAKTEGKILVYDKVPLIFILDVREKSILGMNFHWIKPAKLRLEFFDEVRAIMAKTHMVAKKLERMRLTYRLLLKPKYRLGLQAIRMYYIDNITSLKMIPEKQWDVVIGISQYRARFVYKEKGYKD